MKQNIYLIIFFVSVIVLISCLAGMFFNKDTSRIATTQDYDRLDKQTNCYGNSTMEDNTTWIYRLNADNESCNIEVIDPRINGGQN